MEKYEIGISKFDYRRKDLYEMFVTPYSEYLKKHHSKSLNFFIQ